MPEGFVKVLTITLTDQVMPGNPVVPLKLSDGRTLVFHRTVGKRKAEGPSSHKVANVLVTDAQDLEIHGWKVEGDFPSVYGSAKKAKAKE